MPPAPLEPQSWEEVKAHVTEQGHINWKGLLDGRQEAEVRYSEIYAQGFAHGTDGHNAKLLIAKLARILDIVTASITILPPDHK